MSVHKAPIRLSRKAQQDFIDILRYTGEIWGVRQLESYKRKINEALNLIARNPELGHRREDLPDRCRAHIVGSHVIVYRIEDSGIGVARILHQRMSAPQNL